MKSGVYTSAFTLLMIVINAGCISTKRIENYTAARSTLCEIHGLRMKERIVPQTYGMRRSGWILKLRYAREEMFPHAAESYDTYACNPSHERYARIYVCA